MTPLHRSASFASNTVAAPLGWIGAGILCFGPLLGCSGGEGEETSPTPVITPTPAPEPSPTLTPSPTPIPEPTPTPVPTLKPAAVVVSTDYTTGTLRTIGLDALSLQEETLTVGGDTIAQGFGDHLYVLERSFSGPTWISVRDAVHGYTELFRISLPDGSNPHKVALVNGKGYVSLYNGKGVHIFDPADGDALGFIDLSTLADPDGDPNADELAVDGTTLYAGLQRVDYTNGYTPTSPGKIAVIDTTLADPIYSIDTVGTNIGTIHVETDGNLLVSSLGAYGAADGGIERIDVSEKLSSGFLLDDEDLAAQDLAGFVAIGARGYLLASGVLRTFSLAGVSLETPPASLGALSVSGIGADPRGRLWLATTDPLVWVYDPGTDALLNGEGIEAIPGSSTFYGFAFLDQ